MRFELFARSVAFSDLCFGRAFVACLDFALCAFVNVPMRSRMAQITVPEDKGGIRFDHLEVVFALSWLCHCFETLVSLC